MRAEVLRCLCWTLITVVLGLLARPCQVSAADPSAASRGEPSGAEPARLVALAIAAEVKADRSQHGELLQSAVRAAPDFAPARWQSGEVRYGSSWMTIDDAIAAAACDDLLDQYREMRARYGDSKEGQLVLARWCQKHQLNDELRSHATRLLGLSPGDPEAIKMLGLAWYEGQLLTQAELADRKHQAELAKAMLKVWQPRMQELRRRMESGASDERAAALQQLGDIDDPDAIGALETVFKNHSASALMLVKAFGRMPGQKATDALLRQAMLAKQIEVRLAACEQLRSRSQQSYVPKLMASLSTPLETRFEVVRDADGVRFRQTVRREGAVSAVENTLETDVTTLVPNPNLGTILGAVYGETLRGSQQTAKAATKQNRKIAEVNGSIYWILEQTTGQKLPRDPQAWWGWWRDYNELSTSEKPTLSNTSYQSVDVPYVPYIPADIPIYGAMKSMRCDGCFARGTKVWTLTGERPIEEVKVGDRVLSQSPNSGELTYKPVLDITLGNQALISIDIGQEQIVATRGHVFWISGKGWRMAKDLKVGDRLHCTTGWVEIQSLQPLAADETHNLVVADFNTYFVGDGRVFVHDITMMQPTEALVPGQGQR